MERMKELCKERNSRYEKQDDLKGQKQKIERALEQKNVGRGGCHALCSCGKWKLDMV